MPQPMSPPQPQPAALNMRWLTQKIATGLPFAIGGTDISVKLRAIGILDMVWIRLRGTFTGATAPLVFKPLMPWNLIRKLAVQGGGPLPIHNLGGYGAHLWNLVMKDWAPFVAGFDNAAVGLDVNAYDAGIVDVFPTATGAQTVSLWVGLPFHRSSMDQAGVLPLGVVGQDDTLLTITPVTAKSDVVTTAANFTSESFVVDVYQCMWTTPRGTNVMPLDTSRIFRFEERQTATALVADANTIDLERSGKYLGLIHAVILNGVMDSTDIDSVDLTAGGASLLDPTGKGRDMALQNFIQRRRAGRPFPVGVIVHDLDRFVDDGPLDIRDHLYTGGITELKSVITVNAGATITATDKIYTWTKRQIDLNPAGTALGAG